MDSVLATFDDGEYRRTVCTNLAAGLYHLPQETLEKYRMPWDGFLCKRSLVLDMAIWGRLPLDIQLKLLAHLPLPALLRFQVVCKAWYNGIRSIERVTVHGDCYVARSHESLRVYSSLHEGSLQVPGPPWECRVLISTTDGLLYYSNSMASAVYSPFTRKTFPIPDPPGVERSVIKANLFGGAAGDFTITRILGDGHERMLAVYRSRRGSWETAHLQLPAGEEISVERLGSFSSHGTIDGSVLYFLTVQVGTHEMSVRSIDISRNIDGTSNKILSWSWTSLPSYYSAYRHGDRHFTGDIAVVGGKLFMACKRLISNGEWTVALLVYDKQGKQWDFVSQMPVGNGFVAWRRNKQFVELRSQGDALVVCNDLENFACLYNTSTKAWSLFGGGGRDIYDVCPLKLTMRCHASIIASANL